MKQDVIIIGGSFAGLSAAMQLSRGQRTVTVIDAAQPRNRFASASHGFFTLDGETPSAIREKATQQLSKYNTFTLVNGKAEGATKTEQGFVVTLTDGTELTSHRLILATGLVDKLPELPGLKERWGQTIVHCPYCHGHELKHHAMGVLATSAMSSHQAAMLPDWGVTTLFTQGEFIPDEEELAFLQKRGVTIENTPVKEVLGDAPNIDGVRLADGRVIEIGAMYVGGKTLMASPIAASLGCEIENSDTGESIKTDDFKLTSVEGVYACGDISNQWQNATFASASGVMAGAAVHQSLIQACI